MMGRLFRNLVLLVGIFLLSILPFSKAASFGLVNCDDYDYVVKHPEIAKGFSVEGVRWALGTEEAIWMPLTWCSYMLDHAVSTWISRDDEKGRANVMHVHSLLYHGLNGVLLFLLLLSILRLKTQIGGVAWVACCALLWSMHPLRTESVVWIASRKDVISLFWELVAILCWLRFRLSGTTKIRVAFYVSSLSAFCMGALAKPSVMTFPILVFLVDWLLIGVVLPEQDIREVQAGRPPRADCLIRYAAYLIPLVLAVVLGVSAARAQAAGGATAALSHVSICGRALNACAAFGIYVWHTICPTGLAVQCINRWPEWPRFLIPGLVITAGMAFYVFRELHLHWLQGGDERRGRGVADFVFAGCLWFCIAVVPFLGLSNFGFHAYADRFTYIPSIGFSIAVLPLYVRVTKWQKALEGGMLLLVIGASLMSVLQTSRWHDDKTLWERTLEVDGDGNAEAHISLGMYHFEYDHDLARAVDHFGSAMRHNPEMLERAAHLYVISLCELGRLEEAEKVLGWYKEAAYRMMERKYPGFANDPMRQGMRPLTYLVARATYFATQKNCDQIVQDSLSAAKMSSPNNVNVLYLEGKLAAQNGDVEKAKKIWKTALEEGEGEAYMRHRFLAKK